MKSATRAACAALCVASGALTFTALAQDSQNAPAERPLTKQGSNGSNGGNGNNGAAGGNGSQGDRGDRGGRGEGPRGDGPRGNMPMSPEMVQRIIEVAKDVSPELAERLNKIKDLPPEEVGQAIRQNSRRLVTLAILKQRNPDLYKTRVDELRVQLELHTLGEQYMAASSAGDTKTAQARADEIAKKVKSQVDLDLKARAQEMQALEAEVKRMRTELSEDSQPKARDARIEEQIEAVKKGQPIKGRGPSGGDGRPGDGRSGEARPRPQDGAPADAKPAKP